MSKGSAVTVRETIDILKESSLWNSLTTREKVEALVYAMDGKEGHMAVLEEATDGICELSVSLN
jgi:hypothetical protein